MVPRRLATSLVALVVYVCVVAVVVAVFSFFSRDGGGGQGQGQGQGPGAGAGAGGVWSPPPPGRARPSRDTTRSSARAEAKGISSGGSNLTVYPRPRHSRWCTRDQIVDGHWEPVRLDKPPYHPAHVNDRCTALNNKKRREKGGTTGGWDTYEWVPRAAKAAANATDGANDAEACEFTAWDADLFCERARSATVLIVGDSLSWEHYSSLAQLLGVPMRNGYQHISRTAKVNVDHAACHGRTRLVYRRDDSLTALRKALRQLEPTMPQVLVLNRGAHYVDDRPHVARISAALDAVEEWQGRCDRLGIKCHFFWRTTVPGHVNCHNFTGPVNDLEYMEAYVANASLYPAEALRFHWPDFARQNALAESELQRRRRQHTLRYQVLDAYRLNVLRPDDHSDCLHSCYPGKMDVYSRLLLHYLQIDRSLDDGERLERVVRENRWTINVTTAYYDWKRAGPPRRGPAPT